MEIIISLIGGGVIGFLISFYFHRKSENFVKDMRNLSWSLEQSLLQSKYPHLFSNSGYYSKSYDEQSPIDKDIPHLSEIRTDSYNFFKGSSTKILVRFVDLGRNLKTNGIVIRNDLNNYRIPLFWEGFGWGSFDLFIPIDSPIGKQVLFIEMTDSKEKSNTQKFEYTITVKE